MVKTITLDDGRQISYALDTKSNKAPVVLLANSLCAPYTAWDKVVSVLNAKGYCTLRFDQPGHGDSSAPGDVSTTTFLSMANDVVALLKSLNISKLHGWIGVSMGAALGFYFVVQNPGVVRKFIPCDTISCSPVNAGVDDVFGPRVTAAKEKGHMKDVTQSTLDRWFGTAWQTAHPGETQRMRALMMTTTVEGFEACCNALRSETFDIRPLFHKLASVVEDVLCVVGSKDANLPQTMETMRIKIEEGFSAAGKSGRKISLKTIEDAGHVCFVDGFDQYVQTVVPFLLESSS